MNNATQHVINAFHHPALRDLIADRFDEYRARKIALAALPHGPFEFASPRDYKKVDWKIVADAFNQIASARV